MVDSASSPPTKPEDAGGEPRLANSILPPVVGPPAAHPAAAPLPVASSAGAQLTALLRDPAIFAAVCPPSDAGAPGLAGIPRTALLELVSVLAQKAAAECRSGFVAEALDAADDEWAPIEATAGWRDETPAPGLARLHSSVRLLATAVTRLARSLGAPQ